MVLPCDEMEKSSDTIDFRELPSSVPGEALEQLVRQIGARKNLSPSSSGRGADRGRDLFFTEILSGALSTQKLKWLVYCKDKAVSNESVSESDLPSPSIIDKLAQHNADGFLLVTTTVPGTAAKALLDKLDRSNGGPIYTQVWDGSDLRMFLAEAGNHDLLAQFLPQSYKRFKGLTTLEGAIIQYQQQLPESIFEDVMRLIRPYGGRGIKGSVIWPYDEKSAQTIDEIIRKLVIDNNTSEAVAATKDIELDAFVLMLYRLWADYEKECHKYMLSICSDHLNADIRYNAAQFLIDHYQYKLGHEDYLKIIQGFDVEAITELYSLRITRFVQDELFHNTFGYDVGHDLDAISSHTVLDEIIVSELTIEDAMKERISFHGTLHLGVILNAQDPEGGFDDSYPGEFKGYLDRNGIFLESATVNTDSFYE